MRNVSKTWTAPPAPARTGLADARSTGSAASAAPIRHGLLTDRRSTR